MEDAYFYRAGANRRRAPTQDVPAQVWMPSKGRVLGVPLNGDADDEPREPPPQNETPRHFAVVGGPNAELNGDVVSLQFKFAVLMSINIAFGIMVQLTTSFDESKVEEPVEPGALPRPFTKLDTIEAQDLGWNFAAFICINIFGCAAVHQRVAPLLFLYGASVAAYYLYSWWWFLYTFQGLRFALDVILVYLAHCIQQRVGYTYSIITSANS